MAGMNPDTHAALQTLTCGVDHDVVLIEGDGSPFLESEGVHFYKMKYDADLPVSERYFPSRQKTSTTGILLEPVHDPADMEYLRIAKRGDWAKVLRLLQKWGWAGNTVLMSNGNNGAYHDKSYFDRTLVCTFWRKHRDQNQRTVCELFVPFHPDACLTLLIVPSLTPKGMMVTSDHGSAKTRSLGVN